MSKTAAVILAEGFEEIEAIAVIDVLRRAGITVFVTGLKDREVKSARGVRVITDVLLSGLKEDIDAVVLPGGGKGAENLAASKELKEMILKMNSGGKLVAAICASPAVVLAPLGVLDGKSAACFPGMGDRFSARVKFRDEKVAVDGNVITSQGPATAIEFGLAIAENLAGSAAAKETASKLLLG